MLRSQDYQKKHKGLLDKWKEDSSALSKSLRKSEEKLKDQVNAEREVC